MQGNFQKEVPTSALYVHVPFCKSRCAYCDFYSCRLSELGSVSHAASMPQASDGEGLMRQYVDALLFEMERVAASKGTVRLPSLYFGGGTPSLLPPYAWDAVMERIHSRFTLVPDAEITVEMNPDDVDSHLARHLKALGVNRASLGVQSFHDETLHLLGRRHDARQAVKAVETLHAEGITNLSVDLIYGLPNQTPEAFREDVRTALSLPVSHLSAYALSIEDGTPMERMVARGAWHPADEDTSLRMYTDLMEDMESAGWVHYEISNFARPGFHSRHNSSYWAGTPYIGLGPAAASYDGRRRRRLNLPDLHAYISAARLGIDVPHEEEHLSDDALHNELIMTRLRTCGGLPLNLLAKHDRDEVLLLAEPHLQRGNLQMSDGHLRLTRRALFVADDVISDFMRC